MTIKAIPYGESIVAMRDDIDAMFLVMVAHAGRADRTGAKVHMATATRWANGKVSIHSTDCSNNGQLRGSVVPGRDFSAVTCKKCGAGTDEAERRNAKAIDINI